VHNSSITHHLHAALPVNHHPVTSFQTSAAADDVTTLPRFYSERLTCEAAGQTNAFLHVRITFHDAITLCTVIAVACSYCIAAQRHWASHLRSRGSGFDSWLEVCGNDFLFPFPFHSHFQFNILFPFPFSRHLYSHSLPFPLPEMTIFRILESREMYIQCHAFKTKIDKKQVGKLHQKHYKSSFLIIVIYHYLLLVNQLSIKYVRCSSVPA